MFILLQYQSVRRISQLTALFVHTVFERGRSRRGSDVLFLFDKIYTSIWSRVMLATVNFMFLVSM